MAGFSQSGDERSIWICFRCALIVGKGKGRTQGIIGKPLLLPFYPKFRAIVEGRDSRKGIEQHMDRHKMHLIAKFRINPLHVMVIHEIVKLQPVRPVAAHSIKALDRMGDLKIIMVVVAGIKGFMQMVIGNGMQSALVDPSGIIPMDHFPHKPKLGLHFVGHLAQGFHKIKIQYVCGIQPDPVHIELFDPKSDHVANIILHRRVVLVQFHQQIITAPVFIGKSIVIFIVPPKIHIAVPIFIRGIFPVPFYILKSKKITAGMVEHAVKNNPHPLFMALGYKIGQILVGTQPAVQFFVIRSFVPMADGFKKGADIDGVTANLFYVGNPGDQLIQSMDWFFIRILFWRIGKP